VADFYLDHNVARELVDRLLASALRLVTWVAS
jgi:hypothetical protein